MIPSSLIEVERELHAADLREYSDQPAKAQSAAEATLEARSGWQRFLDWFKTLVDNVRDKLREFASAVSEFFESIKDLDVGDPARLNELGELWLEGKSNLTGIDIFFEPRSLPALRTWQGGAGDIYTAGVPVQRQAVARLATWCGDAGDILLRHSMGVVGVFINMRTAVQSFVWQISAKVAALAAADPAQLLGIISKIVDFAAQIAEAILTMRGKMDDWANRTEEALKTLKSKMADKTGTEQGRWPTFV